MEKDPFLNVYARKPTNKGTIGDQEGLEKITQFKCGQTERKSHQTVTYFVMKVSDLCFLLVRQNLHLIIL